MMLGEEEEAIQDKRIPLLYGCNGMFKGQYRRRIRSCGLQIIAGDLRYAGYINGEKSSHPAGIRIFRGGVVQSEINEHAIAVIHISAHLGRINNIVTFQVYLHTVISLHHNARIITHEDSLPAIAQAGCDKR
jgi:hypothetical protein